jgi:hypothetical protein
VADTYTYTDPDTGVTTTHNIGDGTILPIPSSSIGDISSSATGTGAIAQALGGGGPSGANFPALNLEMLANLQRERLYGLEIPEFNERYKFGREQLGQQGSQFGQQLAQQAEQFKGQLGLSQAQLDQLKAYQSGLLGLQGQQQHTQEVLGRGQLALGGLNLASGEALSRGGLALQGANLAQQGGDQARSLALQAAGQSGNLALQKAQLLSSLRGPENAFAQQAALYGLGEQGGLGLSDILRGDQGVPGFQAPRAPVRSAFDAATAGADPFAGAQQVLTRIAQENAGGGDPTARNLLMRVANENANDPYGSPSSRAALAMSGPNSEYATPGSVLSQIPGLGQRYLDAATKLSQSNYGVVVNDPAATLEARDRARYVRANPEYQRASQTGDVATKTRLELQGFAQAAGLPEELTAPIYAQTEAYRQAHGGEVMPMEQVAQLVQAQAGPVGRQRRQQLIQEILGFDPQTAAAFDADWDKNFANNGGQIPAAVDLERDISRRYGYGTGLPPGAGNATPGGALPPGVALPPPEPREGFGEMGPGRNLGPMVVGPNGEATHAGGGVFQFSGPNEMNYSREPMMGVDPRPPGLNQPPTAMPPFTGGGMMGPGRMSYQRSAPVLTGDPPRTAVDPRPQAMRLGDAPTPAQPQPAGFAQGSPSALARQVTGGIAPNQVNARNFLRLAPSAQKFTLAAFEAQGHDPQDVANTIQQTLPRAVGPRYGRAA